MLERQRPGGRFEFTARRRPGAGPGPGSGRPNAPGSDWREPPCVHRRASPARGRPTRRGSVRSCPHGHFALSCASCRHADRTPRIVLEELSGVSERPMIIRMPTASRPQQRYDHRLRDLVQRTGDLTIATDLGVPRSTARGWLRAAPTVVVSLEVADLTEPELRQEVLKLRRRVEKLTALLRLALALLRTSGFTLTGARLPDGRAKLRILRAVDRARECIPLRAVLRFLRCVAESVPCLAPAAARVCARRSVVLSAHIAASTDAPRGPGDRGHGHLARLPSRPDRHARRPRAAARQGLGLALDLVPPRPEVRLAPPPAPRAPGEAEGGPSHDASRRDVAHRHHRHPPARRDPRLSPCRDRQLLATDPGVASRRHVRTGQQRGRAARSQSGRDALRRRPRSCWRMRAWRT